MTCSDTTMSLGVYVLGALDPAERSVVETHLATCADCRAELASLASLPAMLDLLSLDDLQVEAPAVPDDLFDRVAAQAREEEDDRATSGSRTTRYRWLSAVAAAVVLIAGVSVGAVLVTRHDNPPATVAGHHTGPPITMVTRVGVQGDVRMKVQLAAQTTGTGIRVAVSGLSNNEHCTLIAVAKNGSRDIAGRWDATYEGGAQEIGSTEIPRDQLSKLVLRGTDGRQLVAVAV